MKLDETDHYLLEENLQPEQRGRGAEMNALLAEIDNEIAYEREPWSHELYGLSELLGKSGAAATIIGLFGTVGATALAGLGELHGNPALMDSAKGGLEVSLWGTGGGMAALALSYGLLRVGKFVRKARYYHDKRHEIAEKKNRAAELDAVSLRYDLNPGEQGISIELDSESTVVELAFYQDTHQGFPMRQMAGDAPRNIWRIAFVDTFNGWCIINPVTNSGFRLSELVPAGSVKVFENMGVSNNSIGPELVQTLGILPHNAGKLRMHVYKTRPQGSAMRLAVMIEKGMRAVVTKSARARTDTDMKSAPTIMRLSTERGLVRPAWLDRERIAPMGARQNAVQRGWFETDDERYGDNKRAIMIENTPFLFDGRTITNLVTSATVTVPYDQNIPLGVFRSGQVVLIGADEIPPGAERIGTIQRGYCTSTGTKWTYVVGFRSQGSESVWLGYSRLREATGSSFASEIQQGEVVKLPVDAQNKTTNVFLAEEKLGTSRLGTWLGSISFRAAEHQLEVKSGDGAGQVQLEPNTSLGVDYDPDSHAWKYVRHTYGEHVDLPNIVVFWTGSELYLMFRMYGTTRRKLFVASEQAAKNERERIEYEQSLEHHNSWEAFTQRIRASRESAGSTFEQRLKELQAQLEKQLNRPSLDVDEASLLQQMQCVSGDEEFQWYGMIRELMKKYSVQQVANLLIPGMVSPGHRYNTTQTWQFNFDGQSKPIDLFLYNHGLFAHMAKSLQRPVHFFGDKAASIFHYTPTDQGAPRITEHLLQPDQLKVLFAVLKHVDDAWFVIRQERQAELGQLEQKFEKSAKDNERLAYVRAFLDAKNKADGLTARRKVVLGRVLKLYHPDVSGALSNHPLVAEMRQVAQLLLSEGCPLDPADTVRKKIAVEMMDLKAPLELKK